MTTSLKYIVVGALNTDIFAFGIPNIPPSGGYEYGNSFHILPGGKGRNIADMLSRLVPKNSIAMISKTVKDPHGLWRIPYDSLRKQGINVKGVTLVSPRQRNSSSPVAMILVEKTGANRIIVVPSKEPPLSMRDLVAYKRQFIAVSYNHGCLIVSHELPEVTIRATAKLARSYNVPILLDPGGIKNPSALHSILKTNSIFFIKPNEEETLILTGINPKNNHLTKKAAQKLIDYGAKNVLITRGGKSAYFASKKVQAFISIPTIRKNSPHVKDETGCGDQTIAVFAYAIGNGFSPLEACALAVKGGTLQFYKQGATPISKAELLS